jgi:hypothetical protein
MDIRKNLFSIVFLGLIQQNIFILIVTLNSLNLVLPMFSLLLISFANF